MNVKVKQMIGNYGNPVANQFIISDNRGNTYFQSYNTVIAKRDRNGHVTLDKNYWQYSNTTIKYRNMFLNENTAETKRKIANKEYKLSNLNKA